MKRAKVGSRHHPSRSSPTSPWPCNSSQYPNSPSGFHPKIVIYITQDQLYHIYNSRLVISYDITDHITYMIQKPFEKRHWTLVKELFVRSKSIQTLIMVVEAKLVSSCFSCPSRASPLLSLLSLSVGVMWNTLHSVELGGTETSVSTPATWHLYCAELYRLTARLTIRTSKLVWNMQPNIQQILRSQQNINCQPCQMSANCRTEILIFLTDLELLLVI